MGDEQVCRLRLACNVIPAKACDGICLSDHVIGPEGLLFLTARAQSSLAIVLELGLSVKTGNLSVCVSYTPSGSQVKSMLSHYSSSAS